MSRSPSYCDIFIAGVKAHVATINARIATEREAKRAKRKADKAAARKAARKAKRLAKAKAK